MKLNIVKGNNGLAKALGVSVATVNRWRKNKLLKSATVVDHCRIIVYDLDKVIAILSAYHKTGKS